MRSHLLLKTVQVTYQQAETGCQVSTPANLGIFLRYARVLDR